MTVPDNVLREIAGDLGTPTFVLDGPELRQRALTVASELSVPGFRTQLLYSLKTNYVPWIVSTLMEAGWGVDVVSQHELDLALALGAEGGRLALNGPMKTPNEMAGTLRAGGIVNVDSLSDLDVLDFADPERRGRVGIRVNPGRRVYEGRTSAWNAAAAESARRSKFGATIDNGSAEVLAREIRSRGFRLVGVHCHLGSQITDLDLLVGALEPVVGFAEALHSEGALEVINFGGGMGVAGLVRDRGGRPADDQGTGQELPLHALAEMVGKLLERRGLAGVTVAFEPGRAVVSRPISLLTRVVNRKVQDTTPWVLVDGGLNIMPTFAFGERRAVRNLERRAGLSVAPVSLGGPLCYDGDVMMEGVLLPEDTDMGDLLLIDDAGAYSISRSTNFIRPRAAMALFDGSGWSGIWKRETTSDVFRFSTELDAGRLWGPVTGAAP